MILDALQTALSRLDWKFVTPSSVDYSGKELIEQIWQERLFAYELYHQLRLLWKERPELLAHCVIHAEVRKGYQKIPKFDYMPDLLFHLPESGQNRAVVEIKLAARSITADLKKLVRFGAELGYADLIMVLIGTEREFNRIIQKHSSSTGTLIHLLCLSTDTKETTLRAIEYTTTQHAGA